MKTAALALVLFQMASSHGTKSPAPAPAAAPAAPATAGGIAWTVPKAWSVAPSSSSMRVATYKAAPAPGDPEGVEIAVFYFGPGQGGAVDANVKRWFAQFQPEGKGSAEKQQRTKVNGLDVTLVSTEGTYASGGMMGPATPKKGFALRGAIAEGPEGAVFFKMTGPKTTVARSGPDFDSLVKSLTKPR